MSLAKPSPIFFLRRSFLKAFDTLLPAIGKEDGAFSIAGSCHPVLLSFVRAHGYFSSVRPLACTVTKQPKHVDIALRFLESMEEVIADEGLRRFASDEVLAKVVAYRELVQGMQVGGYRVEEVFDLWAGIPAYGLVSSQEAILLFRGTDLSLTTKRSFASLIADLDPKGAGYSLYLRARPKIRAFLMRYPARCLGFSLGGALASYTALFEKDLLDPTRPSVVFNPPGMLPHAWKKWEGLTPKPSLITYVNRGDPVSLLGRLCGEVRMLKKERPMRPMEAHLTLMCAGEP